MTASITRCWPNAARLLVAAALLIAAMLARAGSIEPIKAQLIPAEDGYSLSAEFAIDLGPRVEEAVSHGIPLYFNLELEVSRPRWYWTNEDVASRGITYRLSYHALTQEYRLATGTLRRRFSNLGDTLRALERFNALPVIDKGALKPGQSYQVAVRLSLDRSQLPKPFQVDAIANKDWQVSAKVLRWQFQPAGDAK